MAGGHHGGAWKVAYADFVTAMMAFFMVMWLITAVSKEQRAAIFDYFKNPSMEPGKSVKPAPGQMGPGGASSSPINLGGGLDAPKTSLQKTDKIGATVMTSPAPPIDLKSEEQKAAEEPRELEKKQLDALMQDLKEAIAKSQALAAVQGSAAAGHHARGTAHPDPRRAEPADVRPGQFAPEGLYERPSCARSRRTCARCPTG